VLVKYPRTPHLVSSRLQPGDEDLDQVPFADLAGHTLAVEEKLDGANSAISFAPDGTLRLQSRGHYLTGGPRERHFAPFKAWAASVAPALRPVLGPDLVLYGEWLYAKHTVYYDALPHYFCEFDILDRRTGQFLDTPGRHALLAGTPVVSVPLLHRGTVADLVALRRFVGPSTAKSPHWRESLAASADAAGVDPARTLADTDLADEMEGLYLKREHGGVVTGRYKWVRPGFSSAVLDSGTHWLDRPIVANQLRDPAVLYATR
jgi:hypothetical protein